MTVKENLAVLENLSCEPLSFDTVKTTDQMLGRQFGDLVTSVEPVLDSSCCCCCTPCCSCSAAVEDHPFS